MLPGLASAHQCHCAYAYSLLPYDPKAAVAMRCERAAINVTIRTSRYALGPRLPATAGPNSFRVAEESATRNVDPSNANTERPFQACFAALANAHASAHRSNSH